MYNTVKQKLANGEQVIGGTIDTPDPDIYRAMARAGFDFIWIEMQHSPLTYQDVARMIWAGRDLPAIPFIRVPDATEGDVQKATDIGALGIIVPMVVDPAKVEAAVRFAKYPPVGGAQPRRRPVRRTMGRQLSPDRQRQHHGGRHDRVAGRRGERRTDRRRPRASTSSSPPPPISSVSRDSPRARREYEAMVTRIKDATLGAGLGLGGPVQWRNREGFNFFQAPTATVLVGRGARDLLSETETLAPIEGSER